MNSADKTFVGFLLTLILMFGVLISSLVTTDNIDRIEQIDSECVLHITQDKRLWFADDKPEKRVVRCATETWSK